jgi:hypothetical protein
MKNQRALIKLIFGFDETDGLFVPLAALGT